MNTASTNRFLPRAILFSLGSLLLLGLSLARAQQVPQYEQDELDAKSKDWKRLLTAKDNEILAMLLGSQSIEVGKMDAYFKKDVFPHFTQVNNAVGTIVVDAKTKKTVTGTALPKMRSEFRKFYFNQIGIIDNDEAGKAREQLNKLLNARLFQITNGQTVDGAAKNYHPLVRFHAALFLSELSNENPGKQLPYAPALGNLYLLAAPKKTPNVPESVRVVALKGIMQHSQAYKIDEARIVPLLVNDVIQPWLTQTTPTGGMTQDGLDWIRRRAMELALELNAKSSDPTRPAVANLPALLAAIAADETAGIPLRIGALNTLTNMKVEAIAGVKDEDLGKAAGAIALASAKLQLHSIKTQPVPPNIAKPLKHDLTLINNSLDVLTKRTAALTKVQENVLDLLEACETRWEDVQDPDAMYKEIQKSAANLDMFLSGKETSSLTPVFVKVPKGFTGSDRPQTYGNPRMQGEGGRGMGGGAP